MVSELIAPKKGIALLPVVKIINNQKLKGASLRHLLAQSNTNLVSQKATYV
jgi:hypothetical protein